MRILLIGLVAFCAGCAPQDDWIAGTWTCEGSQAISTDNDLTRAVVMTFSPVSDGYAYESIGTGWVSSNGNESDKQAIRDEGTAAIRANRLKIDYKSRTMFFADGESRQVLYSMNTYEIDGDGDTFAMTDQGIRDAGAIAYDCSRASAR